jgi:transcriptional pleiotropic regulator of transition state genes
MRSTGIVRKLDELGRVVLPKEIRDRFNYEERQPVEIYIENDCIVLKKYNANPNINHLAEELIHAIVNKNISVSSNMLAELNELKNSCYED